ncbi:glycosyltransferase [Marinibacterium sp. SX1]|uniref:glycosyltransferase n=1 Tax=Marinibacterium sp. SX1 TaxID=3388424 RepID=UPI003D16B716
MLIEIGICTFRRSEILETLRSVADQSVPEGARLRVIVAENDERPAYRDRIEGCARELGLDLHYVHAPARNISIARNSCLDAATGDLLLFIDDDECAGPGWIERLVLTWQASGAGIVFGPAFAEYPDAAPEWMRSNNFHSNIPTRNKGVVETGYSSNVLLDRGDPRVAACRFDLSFGRTGGEDIDFFFRLHRAGVPMTISEDAAVSEKVSPNRLSFGWVLRRRYMTGAIYGTCAAPDNMTRRVSVMAKAAAKSGYCGLRALVAVASRTRCMFWLMRGTFHAGVVAGCIAPPRREVYGGAA